MLLLLLAHFCHSLFCATGKVDLIFKPGFVKGNRYLEEELRLQRLNANMNVEVDERFVQADTDWSVQAVVDEDQL